jgi:outer membrane immunogenic protein
MKKFVALTVVFFAFAGLAQITSAGPERIESKEMAAAPAPPPCNWTGFYIGGQGGYSWSDLSWVDVDEGEPPPGETMVEHRRGGFFAGGQVGYNYQWNWLVLGAEGDLAYSEMKGHSELNLAGGGNIFDTRNDWTGTIGLRAGFAWNHFLFFGKGGAAFVHEKYRWKAVDAVDEEVQPFNAEETQVGPMVGGGVEYAITCHWSLKAEYRHIFLGTYDITGTRIDGGVPEPESYQISTDQDSVLFGINYKF